MNTPRYSYLRNLSSGLALALLAISGLLFLIPAATPAFASNSTALTLTPTTATFVYPGHATAPTTNLQLAVLNPAGNQYAIASITMVIPSGSGWSFNGTAPANCGASGFGSGNWAIVYSSGAVSCTSPGAAEDIPVGFTSSALNFGPLSAPTAANGASAVTVTLTDSVTDSSGGAAYSSGTVTLQGIAAASKIDLSPYQPQATPATFIAGSSPITYTLTLGTAQSGVSVSLATSGTNAGTLSASKVTTGTGGVATFVYTPSNTADASRATCATTPCSAVAATLLSTTNHTYTYTAPAAPSKVVLKLSSATFPKQYNITSFYSPGAKSGNFADFATSATTYQLSDAFANAVSSGVTITSATLSGGSFWGNTNTTTQVTTSSNIATSGALTNVGAKASDYDQAGAYGTTGTFTMTIVGTYSSAGFSATGTSGTMFTSLFDTSANTVKIYGSITSKVGSTMTITYKLTHPQSGITVKITAQDSANASSGFSDGMWVGGSTAYKHTTGSLASVTLTTGSTGSVSASFTLPTQKGITDAFAMSISYYTDSTPYSAKLSGGSNSTVATVAGTVTKFNLQTDFSNTGSGKYPTTSSVAGSTLFAVVYLTDSYGNAATLSASQAAQIQVSLTVSGGSLSAASVLMKSGTSFSNDTVDGNGGVVSWVLPSGSAVGTTFTISASGLFSTATVTLTIVSPNPTITISTVNGKTYTSGSTIYTHSASIAVGGKAAVSPGYAPGSVTIANVYAAQNSAASASYASFATSSPWTFVNGVAFTAGTNTVNFKSGDSNGANSSVTTINVVYDPNAPTITFPTSLVIASGQALTVTITASQSDLNTTSIAVSVNGTATTNFSFAGSALTINGLTSGHKSVAVTAGTLAGLSATVTKVVTVTLSPGQTFTSSAGATSSTSGGFTGASITFTNNNAVSETANVFFVWYNSANQVVSVGGQIAVPFTPGQSQSFFGSYNTPGTYTVHVFIQDSSGNALSPPYTVSVTIP